MNKDEKIKELLKRNSLFYSKDCYSEEKAHQQAEKDFEIIAEYLDELNTRKGLRVGDLLVFNEKDEHFRIAHDWGTSVQTSYSNASYSLGKGDVSHSGSLYPSIPKEFLEATEKEVEAIIWIFSNGFPGAHRGVYLTVPFRVFKMSRNEDAIKYMIEKMEKDLLPVDHPVMVCDRDSPLFEISLTEYFLLRNAGITDVAMTQDCVFNY